MRGGAWRRGDTVGHMSADRPPRLLFVHAHPDDESLATGVTMAHYARTGADVRLLTCTLGDHGEVIPPGLAYLTAGDALGPYRRGELRAAMSELGVTERVLGEDPETAAGAAYRDSGMAGTPENDDPRALCQAPLDEVAAAIREHIAALAPGVVVTYDASGGYGHPDHIRVHQATLAAVAGLPGPERPLVYVVLVPADVAAQSRRWLAAHVDPGAPVTVPGPGDPYPPSVADPGLITHVVTGSVSDLARREAALRAHRTQVSVYDGYYALSNSIAARLEPAEYFARVDPVSGRLLPADGPGRAEGLLP